MKTQLLARLLAFVACSFTIGQALALEPVFYGGNGTTPVDSGLPRVGVIYGVDSSGDLRWYRYDGNGESNRAGNQRWHPNSGNPIGNGWQNFRHVFVTPKEGRFRSSHLTIYAVADNGDLLWYRYEGNGESDRSGSRGWHPNSGNRIGNGWQDFLHIFGSGGVIFAIKPNGDLMWYAYQGGGESNVAGNSGWAANSGNAIGNGWQNFRAVFGGATDAGGRGHVIYAVAQNGDLLWYRYNGNGESNRAGNSGWHPNSANPIGNGW
jgi:hypothetical protein